MKAKKIKRYGKCSFGQDFFSYFGILFIILKRRIDTIERYFNLAPTNLSRLKSVKFISHEIICTFYEYAKDTKTTRQKVEMTC